jgi:hypothetical protein
VADCPGVAWASFVIGVWVGVDGACAKANVARVAVSAVCVKNLFIQFLPWTSHISPGVTLVSTCVTSDNFYL